MRRVWIGLGGAAVAAVAAVAGVQAHRRPSETLAASTAALIVAPLAALAAYAAGLDLVARRRARLAGAALAAAGLALLLAELPQPRSGGAVWLTAALVLGATAPGLAGIAARPDARAAGLAALLATAVWLGLLPTLTFDPAATGCFDCDRNLLLVAGDAGLHDALLHSGLYASAIACGVLALVALPRTPLALGAAAACALGAAGLLASALNGVPALDATTRALWLAQAAALAAAAAGVAVERWRARRLSRRIAGLVADALASPAALRDALGAAIVFPRADGPVDAEGRPAPPPAPAETVTDVVRGGEVIAQLRHAGEANGLASAARAAGLALEHASVRARLRAELADLADSRARLVAASDAERRRLERDLHDGAQQRLIALSVLLPPGGEREQVQRALAELRALAHRIHPAALSDAGLEAAVRDLAEGAGVPTRLERLPADRLPPAVETAAYRLVLDAVECAERDGDGRAVAIAIDGGLTARVALPGVDPAAARLALRHAADRFAALGGRLEVAAAQDGAIAEATCAS